MKRSGFTLIELLVVIAILAVLAVVVVLTLNPAGLLQESRDANRLQDMATLNNAIGYSLADNSSESLGAASTTYISVPDPSATSTAGDQCQGLGLPALPTGDTYQCASPSNYRNTNGTGWIPINLSQLSFGAPLSELPIDPTNSTSTGLYYSYATNGSQFEVASIFESQKYKLQFGTSPMDPDYPEVDAKGSNLALDPLYNPTGLVGWWPLNEGSGTVAYDQSGNGNNGAWSGTQAGTSGYYSGGKVGSYAGYFNGSNNYVTVGSNVALTPSSSITVSAWVNSGNSLQTYGVIFSSSRDCCGTANGIDFYDSYAGGDANLAIWNSTKVGQATVSSAPLANVWQFLAATFDGTTVKIYLNGTLNATSTSSGVIGTPASYAAIIGGLGNAPGLGILGSLNDVRVYNRVLSAAEIAALYNAEK